MRVYSQNKTYIQEMRPIVLGLFKNMTLSELRKYPHYILYLRMIQVAFLDGMKWKDTKGVESSLDSGSSTAPQFYARHESSDSVMEVEAYIPISTLVFILHDKMEDRKIRLMLKYEDKESLSELLKLFDDYYEEIDITNVDDILMMLSDNISVNKVNKDTPTDGS